MAGFYSILTGIPAALSMHQLSAAAFCLGPVGVYFLGLVMTKRPGASFLAAAAYSGLSPCLWFFSILRADAGGPWNLRRLHILVTYGESPHTVSIAFIPIALLFLYLAIDRKQFWPGVGAAIAIGAAVLINTFAAVIVVLACVCLLATVAIDKPWRYLAFLAVLGILTYAWISPLSPPSVIQAIRENSPTVDGDYRFTTRSLIGVLVLVAGFLIVRWAARKASRELQFFWLLTFLLGGIIALGVWGQTYVLPQPHRYQVMFDMSLSLAVVFSIAECIGSTPRLLWGAGVAGFLLLAVAIRADTRYGRKLIQPLDITTTQVYRISQWFNEHMPGQRVMAGGAYSFFLDDFTETPQLFGGADTMLPNSLMRIPGFSIYSGMNAGDRDAEFSTLWLKAMGAHAVLVPGPTSEEGGNPFAHPNKFDGVLPELWRQKDDAIYEVPARSTSLAHVVPTGSVVQHAPIHGLDVAEIEKYVAAINDPSLPDADFQWLTRHSARIRAQLQPGQAVSVQVTHHAGWRATNATIRKDGLGMIVLDSPCTGACEITMEYDGGRELLLAKIASIMTMAGVIIFGAMKWKRTP